MRYAVPKAIYYIPKVKAVFLIVGAKHELHILKIYHEEAVHMKLSARRWARSQRLRSSELPVWVPITSYVRFLNVVFCLLHVFKINLHVILVWVSLIQFGNIFLNAE